MVAAAGSGTRTPFNYDCGLFDFFRKSVYTHNMSASNDKTFAIASALAVRDTCLCNHLRKADRVIMQLYDEALRPHGLKSTQFTLLIAIRLRAPIKQTVLAECTATDRTTLTRNLSSLERQGLIQIQSGTDRRVKEISLTPQGHHRLAVAYPDWRQVQVRTEELLGKPQVRKLLAELSEVTRKLGGN